MIYAAICSFINESLWLCYAKEETALYFHFLILPWIVDIFSSNNTDKEYLSARKTEAFITISNTSKQDFSSMESSCRSFIDGAECALNTLVLLDFDEGMHAFIYCTLSEIMLEKPNSIQCLLALTVKYGKKFDFKSLVSFVLR